MKNAEYWRKEAEEIEKALHKKSEEYYKKAEKQFRMAEKKIADDIEKWYARLADNNEISLAEARKFLDADELEEFKWTIEEYIKHGKENGVSQDWQKELENASAKYHIRRLEAIQTQIQQHIELLYTGLASGLTEHLTNIYEEAYYRTVFEIQKGFGLGTTFATIDDRRIRTVLDTCWAADERTFSDRIWKNKTTLVNELNTILTQSVIRGENPGNYITALAKKMNTSRKNASRLIYTESAFVASQADQDCYKDLGIEEFEFMATLDSHTSEICREMDGNHFKMSEYQIGVNAPPLHPWCYDKETEVFTNNGWKYFKELEKGDYVYTLDKKTLIPEWQKPMRYFSYKYNGEMIYFKNERTDLMVTPEHMLLVQNMDSSVKDRSHKLRKANSIGTKSKNRMLGGCNWSGKELRSAVLGGKETDIETYLKFMAYWLADGSCTKDKGSYNIKIAQCNNQWMADELKNLPFTIYKGKSLMIHSKQLGEELIKFGKCTEKYVPDFIKKLTPKLIKIFLDAYARTDGTTKQGKFWKGYQFGDSITFFTTSNKMAADLGELILKEGGRPSYRLNRCKGREVEFKNGVYKINHDCWCIEWNKQIYSWICNMDVKRNPYNDYVYCVEVEKHNTLLVRRNGKVIWSGNCRSTTVPYFNDEFTIGEQRAARNENGDTYYVPADMKYEEWHEKYVIAREEDNSNKTADYLFRNHTQGQNTTQERLIVSEVISEMPQKVQEALQSGTVIDIGKVGASQYDYVNDILYIAKGAGKSDVVHEIGHMVENKLMDSHKVSLLRQNILREVIPNDFVNEVYYNANNDPVEIFLIKSEKFVSDYQGRVYINDWSELLDENMSVKQELLQEFISEPFREYVENPQRLKQKFPEFYELIMEVVG